MRSTYPMIIGGKPDVGHRTERIISPATGRVFAEVAWAGSSDADRALAAARDAFVAWARTPLSRRVELMGLLRDRILANSEYLRDIVCMEVGKTWAQSEEDVRSIAESLDYYARAIEGFGVEDVADHSAAYRHELRHEPVGVVVAFLAWNFPLLNLGFKLGPALAAGCTLIAKPSPKSPVSAYVVGQFCIDVGIPPGVVNVICGPDGEVAEQLARSSIPALLTLIGSTGTARKLVAAGSTSVKRYSLELGGNAPVLVFADADLAVAADTVASLKFGNAGQICVAPNRVLVQAAIAERFSEMIVERANAIRLGFGKDMAATMGPVIDHASVERLSGMVGDAIAKGARVLAGGGRAAECPDGSYFSPTVVEGVQPSMALYAREVFGPIVSLVEFGSEAEAIRVANDTDTGLVAYVFTSDTNRAVRCADQLQFGEVQVNGARYAIDLPHGGIKQSGVGHDCSALALRDYLAVKRVSIALEAISQPHHSTGPL